MRRFHWCFFFIRAGSILIFMAVLLTAGQFNIQAAPVLGLVTPPTLEDQTPLEPLQDPSTTSYSSRYISGFGEDDRFTVFFENRDASYEISHISTTTGPLGFPADVTGTNIQDTHLLVKDWPYYYGGEWYDYRAWGAVGNNPNHHFYVSEDLVNWILVSTFTIPNAEGFDAGESFVYYGFHDIIIINQRYYGWAEANGGETMLVRSSWGGDVWEAFAMVGGSQLADGPLATPASDVSPTPTGNFFELAGDQGYGKLYIPGDDSGIYLAVNTVAKPSQDQAELEANFIHPANWTWHDGSTGRLTPSQALLYKTDAHDYRETWMVPRSDPQGPWVILYTGDYAGKKALGYATFPSVCEPGKHCILLPIVSK